MDELRLAPPPPDPPLPPSVAATLSEKPPRAPLRLRREPIQLRISRSVASSIAVHLALLILLTGYLFTLPADDGQEPLRVSYSWPSPALDVNAEANAGRGESEESGEDEIGDARDAPASLDPFGGSRDGDPGDASDRERLADSLGAGGAPAGALLAARTGGRERLLREGGGDAETEGALKLALEWLARHQADDGTWQPEEFASRCRDGEHCTHAGEEGHTVGVTALALLPFLGAGHTHRKGPWKDTVRSGIQALLDAQRTNGSFGTGEPGVYEDALALLALSEAYGLTGSARLRPPVERAVARFGRTQAEGGGWRYRARARTADTSITGWVAVALRAARRSGVEVPDVLFARSRDVLTRRTDKRGKVGYLGRGNGPVSLLGVGLFVRAALGEDARGPGLAPVRDRLLRHLPRWDETPLTGFHQGDPMHWTYGALAAHHAGGDLWDAWHARLRPLLLENQRRDGCAAGSWRPSGSTGAAGGRVAQTALLALCLEVYYRYPRALLGRE